MRKEVYERLEPEAREWVDGMVSFAEQIVGVVAALQERVKELLKASSPRIAATAASLRARMD